MKIKRAVEQRVSRVPDVVPLSPFLGWGAHCSACGCLDAFYRPWMRSICHIALPPRLQKIVAAFCFHESSELFEWLWRLLACCASPVVLDRFHQCGAVFWARILDRYMRMIEVFGSCLGGCLEARRSSCRPGSSLSFCGARSKFAWLLSICWRFVAQVLYARVYFIVFSAFSIVCDVAGSRRMDGASCLRFRAGFSCVECKREVVMSLDRARENTACSRCGHHCTIWDNVVGHFLSCVFLANCTSWLGRCSQCAVSYACSLITRVICRVRFVSLCRCGFREFVPNSRRHVISCLGVYCLLSELRFFIVCCLSVCLC